MGKHILVICQYFYPEEFRINDICKEWVKRGHQVTVVTGIPNYPQGRFYKGYGWFKNRAEVYEGVRVIRLPIIPRGNSSIMLILNYLSYVISGFLWKCFTKVKADRVFVFQLSPMTQALVGVWYAKKKKIPCHIYVQDIWPENVIAVTGIKNEKIISVIDKMVNYVYQNCQLILATSPSFVRKIEERKSAWKEKESKVKYWPQYAEEFYKPVEKREIEDFGYDNKFRIVFTGNIGYAQGLSILPQVAALLKEDNVQCEFIVIGDGRYRVEFEKEIAQHNVSDMFKLLGRKKPEEIPNYLAWCDVAFISFADNPLFEMTIPAKLQSYMACGMPILAAAGGETKRIVEDAQCGKICEIGEVDKMRDEIMYFMQCDSVEMRNMSMNAIKYYSDYFEKNRLLDEIESWL